ncbi:MAG: YihA family ribosome biogenesis GTP-binding protein [Deltaproteobacteria bacterium]|nr:YihA family ribosome biogenesis GTP-binding protein [Deltaproteobacteria bacterium]
MKITKAVYVKSFAEKEHLKLTYPNQIAFAGRSNVGKSSILNSLLNRKNLAKTSSTPGKTRMVNLFSVNDSIYFVDLPGFGYAKVPKSMRKNWKDLVEAFLLNNPNLKGMVLIIDIRRGLQEEELAFLEWLSIEEIPSVLVANKIDKLKKQQANRQIAQIRKVLDSEVSRGETVVLIPYSARTGIGKKDLWHEILTLIEG